MAAKGLTDFISNHGVEKSFMGVNLADEIKYQKLLGKPGLTEEETLWPTIANSEP
jgi:hypothetical protein